MTPEIFYIQFQTFLERPLSEYFRDTSPQP